MLISQSKRTGNNIYININAEQRFEASSDLSNYRKYQSAYRITLFKRSATHRHRYKCGTFREQLLYRFLV